MGLVRRLSSPATLLFFLAPMLAELLTSSSPPAEFFSVFGIIFQPILYGSGAIIVRELALRWGKGWTSILILGAAYGIVEEGLLCKSFFDPRWPDLGDLATYGRLAGVNWVWSENLTIFHALFSIAASILLVELIFPEKRRQSWVNGRTITKLSILLGIEVLLGYAVLSWPGHPPYRPSFTATAIAVALVAGLYKLAKVTRIPAPSQSLQEKTVTRPFWFWLIGFLAFPIFFIVPAIMVHAKAPFVMTMLVMAAVTALLMWHVWRMSGGGVAWSDIHRLALASGPVTILAIASPFIELANPSRPDNTTGMTMVGIAAAVFLIWLTVKVRRREA